ncbi:CAZyme family GH35 [Paecilomyces variotii]|nr:CAZyme family GH35 [Paecilomyces variotii]KAJ9291831.1 CAZyme family GH35 [Paecilomyces variotii]KAJ9399628.1 CAZyme family GH35 [Paecilomyces variotii]
MRISLYTSIFFFSSFLPPEHFCTAISNLAPQSSASPHFNYTLNTFYLNGQPFQIIGGQMDPQRIPHQYWRQRLNKARSMGLNTIFSYVYWNLLEPHPGEWDISGNNNIAQYFQIAQEEGLHVVLRPGPYICGEREWGGFPAWLSIIPGLDVRTNQTLFMNYAKRYLERLLVDLRPLQATRGGPILMVQVENEYGSYGDNHNYTASMRDILRRNLDHGTILYTNDGGVQLDLEGGNVPDVLAEIDGDPASGFEARDTYISDRSELGPLLDGEYYTLAPDQWGSNATHNDPEEGDQNNIEGFVKDLDFILGGNNSISLYMFHGGTNFGFGNGAVWRSENYLAAFTTSYDYGAPLDESGRTTPLYYTLREVIQKYSPNGSIPDVVADVPRSSIADFALHPVGDLFDSLPEPTHVTKPITMEFLNQAYGFILYETISTRSYSGLLKPGDRPRDRVLVYINGQKQGVIDSIYETPPKINISLSKGDKLQLLVENLGRVDYWSRESGTENALLQPHKGIVGDVFVGGEVLEEWDVYSLPLDSPPNTTKLLKKKRDNNIQKGEYNNSSVLSKTPVFYSGKFLTSSSKNSSNIADAELAAMELDTFLSIPNGTKGVVWINGFNLGRYWIIGPQQSLYLPGVLLNKDKGGWNEVVVLELEPEDGKVMVGRGLAERVWGNFPDPDAP